jgi:hypothetical protein
MLERVKPMALKTVTVNLPESVYRRAQEAAAATNLSLEKVLEQSITLSLPPLENDLPADILSALSAMSLFSDEQLWRVAESTLEVDKQERLNALIEAGKSRLITPEEEAELEALLDDADLVMLKKAESYHLLTRRGYTIPWINQ